MDLYQTVTDRIVSMIERGAGEWRMPWHAAPAAEPAEPIAMPRNVTGRAYRGVNVPLLWAASEAFGYRSPIWATYKQWQERGAQVRKGEKATMVVFWKRIEVASESEDDEGEGDTETRLIARGYAVFNAAQVEGFAPKLADRTGKRSEPQRIEAAEAFFRNAGAIVRHGGNRASTRRRAIISKCRSFGSSSLPIATTRPWLMNTSIGPARRTVAPARSASGSAMKPTPSRNWLPNLAPPSFVPISACRTYRGRITRPTSRHGSAC